MEYKLKKDCIEVVTDDLIDAIELAKNILGEDIAEIEDYFSYFKGQEKTDRFVFVTPAHRFFPKR